MAPKAGRGSDQFVVRLPDGLRDRIKMAAEENGRSMNAEVVATLEDKYPAPTPEEAMQNLLALAQGFLNAGLLSPESAVMVQEIRDLAEEVVGRMKSRSS